jgi:hypothetical protein
LTQNTQNSRFLTFLSQRYTHHTKQATKEPQTQNISVRDVLKINNYYINLLTAEICNDLAAGKYELLPYTATKREQYKQTTELLHARNIKRPHFAAVRLPETITRGFAALDLQPPEKPDFSQIKGLKAGAKLIVWLCRCERLLINTELATEHEHDRAALLTAISNEISNIKFFK